MVVTNQSARHCESKQRRIEVRDIPRARIGTRVPARCERTYVARALGQTPGANLHPWIDYYNHQRPHGSLNYKPPISRSDIGTTS
jgi:transposase InsO family protein